MSGRAKLGICAGIVLCLVAIALLASGSVLGLLLLLILIAAAAFIARRSGSGSAR